MEFFPGTTSEEVLYCVNPTLNDELYNTAILHVGLSNN